MGVVPLVEVGTRAIPAGRQAGVPSPRPNEVLGTVGFPLLSLTQGGIK
jgi:hypothetical protein